ncbi:MAG: alpha/beta fold hydrolase [Anaerolineae bacterium]|nr:alpha/beta fold hydrolase [Anaerolineae bacterium]
MVKHTFATEPFRPMRGLSNPHAQTIAAYYLRSEKGVAFRRERMETPDGDFVLLDYADVPGHTWRDLGTAAPIALLLHGLEGHARRGYICETVKHLAQHGIRSVGLNFRSCGGEMNRLGRSYHIGFTDDVTLVLDRLHARYPAVAFGVVGFSLGGNVLLKYLGEQGERASGRIAAAVAVSNPFDIAAGIDVFSNGSGRRYAQRFLKELRAKALAKADLIGAVVDLEQVAAAQTVTAFDDACTAPLWGFENARDYYDRSSCIRYLPAIRVPTLLLRALDDPLMALDVPFQLVHDQPWLVPGFTTRGGHLGFVAGSVPWRGAFWAERQAARFLAALLV